MQRAEEPVGFKGPNSQTRAGAFLSRCLPVIITFLKELRVCSQASDGSSSRDDLPAQLLRRNDQIRRLEAKLSGRRRQAPDARRHLCCAAFTASFRFCLDSPAPLGRRLTSGLGNATFGSRGLCVSVSAGLASLPVRTVSSQAHQTHPLPSSVYGGVAAPLG